MPAALQPDTIGPVDVAVILFEGNEFNGDVAPALSDLNDSGTVRVIDLAFVSKEKDESISSPRWPTQMSLTHSSASTTRTSTC